MKHLTRLVDCHTHSSFSGDSQVLIKDAAHRTQERGLGGITFTDHLELSHPIPEHSMTFDFAERSQQLDQLRQNLGTTIKILKGLEVGFQPHIAQEAQAIIQNHDFDFIICSTHVVDGIGENSFYENKTKQQAYNRYLEAVYRAVTTFDDFDIVGHIGYVCRYAPYQDKSLRYVDYADILDAILKTVIEKGKGIEINTAGYFMQLGFPHPDFDTIKRYKELGGSIITLGSDAHNLERIGDHFGFVVDQLTTLGFSYVTYFENRKPIFVKI